MKLNRITGPVFAVITIAALGFGCSARSYDSVLTVDGTAVPPALYQLCQLQSFLTAAQTVGSSTPAAVLSATIENTAGADWVHSQTVEALREFQYNNTEFDRQKLSFTSDELTNFESNVKSSWTPYATLYQNNGIDYDTFYQYNLSLYKAQKLFESLYAGVTDDTLKQYFETNYLHIECVLLPRVDSTGTALADEKLQQIQQIGDDALAELQLSSAAAPFTTVALQAVSDAYPIAGFSAPAADSASSYIQTPYLLIGDTADGFDGALTSAAQQVEIGAYGLYRDEQSLILFHRLPNYETDAQFASLRSALLKKMWGDEFTKNCKAVWDAYTVEEDSSAVSYYSPKKITFASAATAAPSSPGAGSNS